MYPFLSDRLGTASSAVPQAATQANSRSGRVGVGAVSEEIGSPASGLAEEDSGAGLSLDEDSGGICLVVEDTGKEEERTGFEGYWSEWRK